MSETIQVAVSRFDPSVDTEAYDQFYQIPVSRGMSVMDALDYIYENLDPSLAYYDHAACQQGICRRCTIHINGKVSLMCQTLVEGDLKLEPLPRFAVGKDLVSKRGER